MKKEEKLLSLMGNMEDRFIMEAEEYRPTHRSIKFKKVIAVAAAFVFVMAIGITGVATNESWRGFVEKKLGIVSRTENGYEPCYATAVKLENSTISLISEFCTGNQITAYFEVSPANESYEWHIQHQDESVYDKAIISQLDCLGNRDGKMLLKFTVAFENVSEINEIPLKFYVSPKGEEVTDNNITFSDIMIITPVSSNYLHAPTNSEAINSKANSTAKIEAINVGSGSIEVTLNCERFETWCNRECVPDRGVSFMEGYTDKTWNPAKTDASYFTEEDERAIAEAFSNTWAEEITREMATIKVTLKDGTVLNVSGNPVVTENTSETLKGEYDSFTYRYTILPIIDIDQVDRIEFMGQPLVYSIENYTF